MKRKHLYLYQICLLLFTTSLSAQRETGLLFTAPTEAKDGIQLKWLTREIATKEGCNLYRRETGTSSWIRINTEPLVIGKIPIPAAKLAADTSLQIAQQLALRENLENIPGMARVNIVTFAIVDPDFARFLGIHYDDREAVAETSYEYQVRFLRSGREQVVATSQAVSTNDPPAYPQAPSIAGVYDKVDKQVDFNWQHDEKLAFAYHIDRLDPGTGERLRVNKRPIMILDNAGEGPEFHDPTPGNAQFYRYELHSIDYLGRVSPLSTSVEIELPDLLAPDAPTSPGSDNSVDGEITLSWTASTSPDVKNYRIYRAPDVQTPVEFVGETAGKETSYHDNSLPGYGYYYYEITAVDEAGNESEMPLFHIANATDLYPPAAPENVKISAVSGEVKLTWDKNKEGDIAGYVIMRSVDVKGTNDWAALHVAPFPENNFQDKLPKSRRNTMFYHVIAMDTTGNRSEPSGIVRIAMPDEVAPPTPFLQSLRSSGDSLFLQWEAVTEADMQGYLLERKTDGEFVKIGTPGKGDHSYIDTGLEAGVKVEYRLSSVDTVGNVSVPSAPLSARVRGNNTGPKTFPLDGKYRKRDEAVQLEWPQGDGESYVFRRAGAAGRFLPISGTLTENEYIDKPKKTGRYDYLVKTYFPDGTRADSGVLTIIIK